MIKILIALSLLISTPVWAEWTWIGYTDKDNAYLDLETIRKNKNRRTVWALSDYFIPDKNGEMSMRTQLEFDCINRTYRILAGSTHSDKMANGETLFIRDFPHSESSSIAPGTIAETRLKMVCSK